ncbi:hypothetical protein [Dyella acidisoli]|uniref:Uncharacterized protein n=1 Tax=Dyella acidisoli TaxID=1867834 RepID=A0ABQ5XPV1_9GAMM|nr:hypothetical protein [Dyella acidisoli]GLQ93083.1 hypothetical protein GCM10007901_20340 [Dyella acidisoli]
MSGGCNREFIADPVGYSNNKTILVPHHLDGVGFWGVRQDGPFDLREVNGSGFSGTVLVLNHMTNRGRAGGFFSKRIEGVWLPYSPGTFKTFEVKARTIPFFVFTSKLGGCALGIKEGKKADTKFAHDASYKQEKNLTGWDLPLFQKTYDPADRGLNVTAFFWWDGKDWSIGKSAIYDADGRGQRIHGEEYAMALGPRT